MSSVVKIITSRHRASTPCLKNVPPLTCYNLDMHDPVAVIFGRSVTEKVRT